MTDNSEELYKRGIEAFKNQDFNQAIELFDKSVDLNPKNVRAWLCLAEIFGEIYEDYDRALEAIQNVNKIKYGTIEPYKYYIQEPDLLEILYNELHTIFEGAIAKLDWDPITFLFFLDKPYEENLKLYNNYLKQLSFNTRLSKEKISNIWFNFTLLNLYNEKIQDAIDSGEKSVEMNPNFKYAWSYLSLAYLKKEEYNNALDAIEKALKLDENFDFGKYIHEIILNRVEKHNKAKESEEIEEIKDFEELEEIKVIKDVKEVYYQRQRICKSEKEFLEDLEHVLGEPIPAVHKINWKEIESTFGFEAKNGHIVGLGLEMKLLLNIPESIGNLKYLKILTIHNCCNLLGLPDNIVKLQNLEKFQYMHGMLGKSSKSCPLDEKIASLKNLRILDVSNSDCLTSIPESILNLPNIKEINIENNYILKQNLPKEIPELYFMVGNDLSKILFYSKKKSQILNTTEDIRIGLINKDITEPDAIRTLISLIENSPDQLARFQSLEIIEKFKLMNETLFKTIENLAVSDENIMIRNIALKVIIRNFPKKSLNLIKWIFENEKSVEVISFLKKLIQETNDPDLEELHRNFKERFVLIDIEKLVNTRLPDIYTLKNDEKKNFGFISENGKIVKLCLSSSGYTFNHLLDKIPESVGELERLEELNLTGCQKLISLPETIGNLKNLKTLKLSGCTALKELPENIGQLKNLQILNMNDCVQLKSIPSSIGGLESIQELNFTNCVSLIDIPNTIKNLNKLKKLSFQNCRSLVTVPDTIAELNVLELLDFSECRMLEEMPKEIGNLKTLKYLKLNCCTRLKMLPESIGKLDLKELDLSFCYALLQLPNNITIISGLKALKLKGCRELTLLPNNIGNLKNLEELSLYACRKIKIIPDSIGSLISLQILDLSYCDGLISLPKTINNLNSLKKIYSIDGKEANSTKEVKVKPLMYTFPQYKIEGIDNRSTKDYIKYFKIHEEDAKILNLMCLNHKINLQKAELWEEPGDPAHHMEHYKLNRYGNIIEIYIFHFEGGIIEAFPVEACYLPQLEVLDVLINEINTIPDEIINLKSLRCLGGGSYYSGSFKIPAHLQSFIKSLENSNNW